ncbi:MAG: S-layer homology domain-containing protein [Candidatus Margulisbacteria bacterium]|jgi:hypothetical protein|nr:S-layer homology domain-containing protein [Candidatus Margulisiibacteriota bacterium]
MRKAFIWVLVFFLVVLGQCSTVSAAKFANDPTQLSIGARVLGMGGGFTGIADDTSAIYLNPAGLDRVDDWQLSTMSGKFLNLYDYSQISALYPTLNGTFGIGYGGSNIEFRFPSSEVIIIGDEVRIIPTGEVSGKYANTALMFSYANHFRPWFWDLNDVHLGASLKILNQDLAATGITSNRASGMELNLGMLYPLNQQWGFGANLVNALPASMGGKITWSSTLIETLPASLKLGLAYRPNPNLVLALDQDRQLTRRDTPDLYHLGAEWFPSKTVAVRAGLDQSITADTAGNPAVSNDFSAGLGFMYNGFRFDYAYHTYNNLSANTTHYFSLTYGIWPEKLAEKRKVEFFDISSPADRSFLFEETVPFKGQVIDRRVSVVKVRGEQVSVGRDGQFETEVALPLGRNRILLEAYDSKGNLLKKVNWRLVRMPIFWDVEADHWARPAIGKLAALGVVRGYPNGSFQPDDLIIRSELVTLLMRSVGSEETTAQTPFSDVKPRHWARGYINSASKLGVVEGYKDGTFQPAKAISRAEGAMILARFDHLPNVRVLEAPYADVPGRHWAARAITQLKEHGTFDFIKGDNFGWREKMSRGETAYMLIKTNTLNDRLEKMFDD